MLIKGGFCLAGGSDGGGRCTFTPAAFIIKLVPSTTGSSEQPSLKPRQLLLQWTAASPQELFATDTSIQAHHRAVPISSPTSSPRPSKSTPAHTTCCAAHNTVFLVVLAGTQGFPPSDTFQACSGAMEREVSTLPCTGKETRVQSYSQWNVPSASSEPDTVV